MLGRLRQEALKFSKSSSISKFEASLGCIKSHQKMKEGERGKNKHTFMLCLGWGSSVVGQEAKLHPSTGKYFSTLQVILFLEGGWGEGTTDPVHG